MVSTQQIFVEQETCPALGSGETEAKKTGSLLWRSLQSGVCVCVLVAVCVGGVEWGGRQPFIWYDTDLNEM